MQTPYRIVVAEDEAVLLSLLVRMIQRWEPGALVRGYQNGLQALHSYDQEGADLLVVNHWMPELDGLRLIRLLRARRDIVPIIGISGDPFNREAQLTAGASAFVESLRLFEELPGLLAHFKPGEEDHNFKVLDWVAALEQCRCGAVRCGE